MSAILLLKALKESLINQKAITAVDVDIIDNAIKELETKNQLEEELGIDLVKLIECVRNPKGIWKKEPSGKLFNTRCMLACYFGRWQIYDQETIYDLKDYGKTWALTKEELL